MGQKYLTVSKGNRTNEGSFFFFLQEKCMAGLPGDQVSGRNIEVSV